MYNVSEFSTTDDLDPPLSLFGKKFNYELKKITIKTYECIRGRIRFPEYGMHSEHARKYNLDYCYRLHDGEDSARPPYGCVFAGDIRVNFDLITRRVALNHLRVCFIPTSQNSVTNSSGVTKLYVFRPKSSPSRIFCFFFIYFYMSRMTNRLIPKTHNLIPKTFSAKCYLHNTLIIEYSESYYV